MIKEIKFTDKALKQIDNLLSKKSSILRDTDFEVLNIFIIIYQFAN